MSFGLVKYLSRSGACFSKVPRTFRAQKATCQTAIPLFSNDDLLTCLYVRKTMKNARSPVHSAWQSKIWIRDEANHREEKFWCWTSVESRFFTNFWQKVNLTQLQKLQNGWHSFLIIMVATCHHCRTDLVTHLFSPLLFTFATLKRGIGVGWGWSFNQKTFLLKRLYSSPFLGYWEKQFFKLQIQLRECVKGQIFFFRTLLLYKDHSMKLVMKNITSKGCFQIDQHCNPNLEIDSKLCYKTASSCLAFNVTSCSSYCNKLERHWRSWN